MTYSNTATHSCPASQGPSFSPQATSQTHAAYIAAISPAVTAAITQLLLCLTAVISRASGSASGFGRAQRSVKGAAAISALAMIMVFLPGTYAQKKALIESHFAKAAARAQKLHKAYLVWRQRKCWMWGGGFMRAIMARSLCGVALAKDRSSYDALIPN